MQTHWDEALLNFDHLLVKREHPAISLRVSSVFTHWVRKILRDLTGKILNRSAQDWNRAGKVSGSWPAVYKTISGRDRFDRGGVAAILIIDGRPWEGRSECNH